MPDATSFLPARSRTRTHSTSVWFLICFFLWCSDDSTRGNMIWQWVARPTISTTYSTTPRVACMTSCPLFNMIWISAEANLGTARLLRLPYSCHNFLSTRSHHMSTGMSFLRSNVLLTPLLLLPLLNGQCTPPLLLVVPHSLRAQCILKVLLTLQHGATSTGPLMMALAPRLLLPPLAVIPVVICLPQGKSVKGSSRNIWVQTWE